MLPLGADHSLHFGILPGPETNDGRADLNSDEAPAEIDVARATKNADNDHGGLSTAMSTETGVTDRLAEIEAATIGIGCTANWGETQWLIEEVKQSRADLEAARAEIEQLKAALEHKTLGNCHADDGTHHSGCAGWEAMRDAEVERLRAPVPVVLFCPYCDRQHLDEGEWATRSHKTHLCEHCGREWRPSDRPTVGVQRLESEQAAQPEGDSHISPYCGLCVQAGCAEHTVHCTATVPHTRELHTRGKPHGLITPDHA